MRRRVTAPRRGHDSQTPLQRLTDTGTGWDSDGGAGAAADCDADADCETTTTTETPTATATKKRPRTTDVKPGQAGFDESRRQDLRELVTTVDDSHGAVTCADFLASASVSDLARRCMCGASQTIKAATHCYNNYLQQYRKRNPAAVYTRAVAPECSMKTSSVLVVSQLKGWTGTRVLGPILDQSLGEVHESQPLQQKYSMVTKSICLQVTKSICLVCSCVCQSVYMTVYLSVCPCDCLCLEKVSSAGKAQRVQLLYEGYVSVVGFCTRSGSTMATTHC